MAPGYTDPIQFKSGNPYGTSHVAGDGKLSDAAIAWQPASSPEAASHGVGEGLGGVPR